MAMGALREGYIGLVRIHIFAVIERIATYIWHFFRDVRDSIKTSKTIQWIHKASDEANSLIVPTSIIDPSCKNKFRTLVGWCAGNDSNKNHEPSNLQVEK